MTYEDALSRTSHEPFVGLGIQLGPPLVGIDLDWKNLVHLTPFSDIPDYAREIIESQDSYTEWSPSGLGCHILCSGSIDKAVKTKNIEVYGEGRFFTVTGRSIRESAVSAYRPIHVTAERAPVVPTGERDNRLWNFGIKVFHSGCKTEESIYQAMLAFSKNFADPDIDLGKTRDKARRIAAGELTPELETRVTFMNDVADETLDWLWEGKVPLCHLTMFVGQPGAGKSSMAQYLAADISRRGLKTLILNAEEHAPTSTKPRLRCMGGDLSQIAVIQVLGVDGRKQDLRLDTQVDQLEQALNVHPDVKLVIIDPVTSHLGDANMNKETDVRAVLSRLADLAEKKKIAVIMVSHFNKKDSTDAKDRALGAKAFVGFPRIVWTFQKDPDDTEKRLMVPGKAEHLKGRRFEIVEAVDTPSGNKVGVVVLGGEVDGTGDSVLEEHKEKPSDRTRKDIIEYVLEKLEEAGEPVDAGRLQAAAAETFAVSIKTVQRAMRGKVEAAQTGIGKAKRWLWSLTKGKERLF